MFAAQNTIELKKKKGWTERTSGKREEGNEPERSRLPRGYYSGQAGNYVLFMPIENTKRICSRIPFVRRGPA